MSNQHTGNLLNSITFEEHDGSLNAKKVSLVSAATIYAVTTSTTVGLTTLAPSPNFIGLTTTIVANAMVTVTLGTKLDSTNDAVAIGGNVTLSDPKTFIGSVSVGGIVDSKGYIGLVTATPGAAWPDPKGYIGLVTITGALSAAAGNVTLDKGSLTGITGNVTLSDPKTFIGSVSVGGIVDSKNYIGLVTATPAAAWPDPKGYIGLVTITGALSAAAGNVTLDKGSLTGIVGNVTLSDSKGFIGLVTVGGIGTLTLADPKGFIGLVTIGGMSQVTLGDSKGYIGLVTATLVGFSSLYTSLASIVSATGLATILVPPSGKIAVIKDLHVSSLGRGEVSFWVVNSSATGIRIPWTSLSTTSGFFEHYGTDGLNVGGANDGLTVNLNGAATVSWMTNVKFI